MASADSDDELALSSSTLDALKSFYAERDAHSEKFAKLQAEAEERLAGSGTLSMDMFTEDWNESQFWYSDETATLLADQLLTGATNETTIAVVSAPSVFVALKNVVNASNGPKPKMVLLEHDNRFNVFGEEFIFYDFAQPLIEYKAHLKGSIDRFIVDPPFLSEDCQTKAALTVRWMAKSVEDTKLVLCTGERMETLVTKVYRAFGLKTTDYEPVHARGLSNEFYCYANFEADGVWKWRAEC
ncbi:hypothetical protein OQA88_8815 [Cercophora sp. LCS_1]